MTHENTLHTRETVEFLVSIDFLSLRPANKLLCPDDQFAAFCKALTEVIEGTYSNPSPLHLAIIHVYLRFDEEEELTKSQLKTLLSYIAESAHLLADNQLHKGQLVHVWNIEKHQLHPWIEWFSEMCTPHSETKFLPPLDALKSPHRLTRIETQCIWLEEAQKQHNRDADADNENEITHELKLEKDTFRGFTTATLSKLYEDTDFIQLTQKELAPGVIELTLDWDTSTTMVNHSFEIDSRIAEAHRLDEAAAAENEVVPEYPYTVSIKTANAA